MTRALPAMALIALLLAVAATLAQPPVVETSPLRGEMCLNDQWRFMPAAGAAAEHPTGAWGVLRVPGSWSRCGSLPGVEERPEGAPWTDVDLEQLGRGWYEYDVSIPAEWEGRAILLELTRVSTDAVIYANGIECGEIHWPRGEVDITDAVTPGEVATLRILVLSVHDQEEVVVYMGVGEGMQWTEPASLASRGIIGEAFLRSQPAGAHVGGVFVQPSVRDESITLDVHLADVTQAGDVAFTARMLDESGAVERVFEATRAVDAANSQTVSLTWDWPDPRLWDLWQPELYTLILEAEGAGIADAYSQEFGFREFWIDGLSFYLNGTEIRLRPINVSDNYNSAAWVVEAIEYTLGQYREMGFNIGEHWPNDESERGSVFLRDLWEEAADRMGFLMVGTLPRLNEYVIGEQWRFAWDDPGQSEAYRRAVRAEVRRMGNHPSIVMWAQSANFFGRYQDQAPSTIGRRGFYEYDDKARAGLEGVEIARSIDPTRPIFNHHGADIGDMQTCNNYLDLIPLQEREEWLSSYVDGADIPFLPIEFGTPLAPTFMRGRNGFGPAISSEPLVTEFAAIYLGAEAYELETQAYRDAIVSRHQGGMSYQSWHGRPELDGAPPMQAVIELFLQNTWHSWRTWPLSAGMVPWSLAHGWHNPQEGRYAETDYDAIPGARGARPQRVRTREMSHYDPEAGWEVRPSGHALMEVNGATLAYIAGAPEHFTDKDHHYVGGETISKQVVLINDSRDTLPYSYELRAATPLELESTSGSGELAPAEILMVPWTTEAPAVERPTGVTLALSASIGEEEHTDAFHLRLYPDPEPTATESVVLIHDPEGDTTALLSGLGYAIEQWDGQPAPQQVLVMGRNSTVDFASLPGSIAEHVGAGGRVVIFGQEPEVLRDSLGLRVARHVSRRAFVVPTMMEHPIAQGLDSIDLRDWRGSGTSVAEEWGGPDEFPTVDPPYGWHWGNRGSVSGGMVEKPHHSGWRPLLEGEFDLAYSPLMELSFGEGYAVMCQLDLEARTDTDPVATELARRIVDHALTAGPEPRAQSTVYLGGPEGAATLFRVGLVYESAESLPESGLVILGEEHGVSDDALRTFLAAGGRALILPLGERLPLGLTTSARATHGSLSPPLWPEARGLSASDLRLRVDVELPLFADSEDAEIGADGLLARIAEGAGVAVAVAALPDDLGTRRNTYLRYSAWRLERTLCQILANLGAEFEMDEKSLTPGWNMEFVPIGIAGEWRFQVEHKLPATDDPANRPEDPGMTGTDEDWHLPDYDHSDWARVELPGAWEDWPGVGEAEGSFWLRKWVQIPETWEGEELMLQLGSIDDHDVTFFNGVQVGAMDDFSAERSYQIPADLVTAGPNLIAIRVFDNYGGGGVYASAVQMRIGRVAPVRMPAGQEILLNTTFEDELEGWDANFMGDAKGTAELTTDAPGELMGARSVRFQVDEASETSWHANFAQRGFGIEAGTQYVYSFWAKASEPCTITAAIERDHPPYGGAGFWEHVNLTPEWQHFEFDFIPEASDSQTRFVFQELARQPMIYHFCRPSFRVKDTASEPDPDALAGFYHPDYLKGHDLGDDPYRYHRW